MPTRAGGMPTTTTPSHVKVVVEYEKVEILDSLISMNLSTSQCNESNLLNADNDHDDIEDFNLEFLEQSCTKLLDCDNSLEGFHFEDDDFMRFDGEDSTRELEIDMDTCTVVDLPADTNNSRCLCLDIESPLNNLVGYDGQETEEDGVETEEIGEEEALLLAEAAKLVGDESSDRESVGPVDKKEDQASSSQCSNLKGSNKSSSCAASSSSGRRKTKVDWTPELHRRFVQAVEQLGVEKAIPSRILELMGVQCLTRHNIASHLQKYRSHRRHMIARDVEAASWQHRRPLTWARSQREGNAWLAPMMMQTGCGSSGGHSFAPVTGLPPFQPHHHHHPHLPQAHGHHHIGAPLVVWGHPTVDHSPSHMWHQQQPAAAAAVNTLPFWQQPDGTFWQQQQAAAAPASIGSWTYSSSLPPGVPSPVLRAPPYASSSPPSASSGIAQMMMTPAGITSETFFIDESNMTPGAMYQTSEHPDSAADISAAAGAAACSKPCDFPPPKEILDAVISEALANPCTPLPLGLKPPSAAGVMAELCRQGIFNVVAPSIS